MAVITAITQKANKPYIQVKESERNWQWYELKGIKYKSRDKVAVVLEEDKKRILRSVISFEVMLDYLPPKKVKTTQLLDMDQLAEKIGISSSSIKHMSDEALLDKYGVHLVGTYRRKKLYTRI